MSLWVCSKWNERPTNSEKWEVLSEHDHGYKVVVPKPLALGTESWFPKSDYRPCEPPKPPERWEDVTAECRAFIWTWDGKEDDTAYYISHDGEMVKENGGYRLRKVQLYLARPDSEQNCIRWAFVVEKKVTA